MSLIPSIISPVTQPLNSSLRATADLPSNPGNPNVVAPASGSEGSGTARSGADAGGTHNRAKDSGRAGPGNARRGASDESAGVNGSTSKSGNDGATRTGNAGLLSRSTTVSESGVREGRGAKESETENRPRTENIDKPFQAERSVVERIFELNPSTNVTDIISRVESTQSDEAKINAQQFINRLGELRRSDSSVETANDAPVSLDTDGSSDPVGRYDKTA